MMFITIDRRDKQCPRYIRTTLVYVLKHVFSSLRILNQFYHQSAFYSLIGTKEHKYIIIQRRNTNKEAMM